MNRGFGFLIGVCFLGLSHCVRAENCNRIVSLAPSISEILISLNLSSSIVSVSRYDELASKVQNVGGLLDPSIEGIISAKPSIVLGLTEQRDLIDRLRALGANTRLIEHRTLSGILQSIVDVGKVCGRELIAESVHKEIIETLDSLKHRHRLDSSKKVLIVVSRDYESISLRDLYVSGDDGYYSYILPYIGAQNVVKGRTTSFSSVSLEYLSMIDPDVIIEVLPPNFFAVHSKETLLRAWKVAGSLRAVRENKVFLLDEPWATIPGPKVTLLANSMMELIHAK